MIKTFPYIFLIGLSLVKVVFQMVLYEALFYREYWKQVTCFSESAVADAIS